LIKQSQITVRGRQSIDSNLARVDLNTRSGAPTELTPTRQFPKILGLGANLTVPGTRLSGRSHPVHPASHMYPPPGCKAVGDSSRVVIVSSRTVSLRY
jgi:hypothetical protein